jgi:hypothetical protein
VRDNQFLFATRAFSHKQNKRQRGLSVTVKIDSYETWASVTMVFLEQSSVVFVKVGPGDNSCARILFCDFIPQAGRKRALILHLSSNDYLVGRKQVETHRAKRHKHHSQSDSSLIYCRRYLHRIHSACIRVCPVLHWDTLDSDARVGQAECDSAFHLL